MSRLASVRRGIGSIVLGVVVGVVTLAGTALPGLAIDDPLVRDAGWWWRAQTGVGPIIPGPAYVGEDQLLVEATPEGATAYLAVSAQLPDGEVNPVLTLTVAQDGTTPETVLVACQAGSVWTGTQAGRWDAAPDVDCATGSVSGIRADDGSSWTFPLGPLQFNDKFNVVVVPAVTAGESSPAPFQVTFERPTGADITTEPGTPPAPSTTTSPPTTAFVAPPTDSGGSSPTTQFRPPPPPPTTVAPVVPAIEEDKQGQSATAPAVNEATAPTLPATTPIVADDGSSRTLARIAGLLVALGAVAAGVWATRGGLLASPAATATTPVSGGLGRFRRERTAEPNDIA